MRRLRCQELFGDAVAGKEGCDGGVLASETAVELIGVFGASAH